MCKASGKEEVKSVGHSMEELIRIGGISLSTQNGERSATLDLGVMS